MVDEYQFLRRIIIVFSDRLSGIMITRSEWATFARSTADAQSRKSQGRRAPSVAPRRLELRSSAPAACVQDHRSQMACGAQLRLAWSQSALWSKDYEYCVRAEALRPSLKSPQHADP